VRQGPAWDLIPMSRDLRRATRAPRSRAARRACRRTRGCKTGASGRLWDFENGQIDFGGITPDTRDLIKLIFMDFMLVHGNDWFLIPLEQTAGSLCRIDSLVVHDVFGGATEIVRADANAGAVDQRWTMFSTPGQSAPHALSEFFVLPSNAGPASQRGLVVEEVLFLRDEMANMAWAVEVSSKERTDHGEPPVDRGEDREAEADGNSRPCGDRACARRRSPAQMVDPGPEDRHDRRNQGTGRERGALSSPGSA
jgi:hypothetical protein